MILVTGANGMVGNYILDFYPKEEVCLTDVDTVDIRNGAQIRGLVESLRPNLVIHLAAETNVDFCEKNIDHAYKSNVIGTLNVALACQKYDAEMVYVSTLGVFGGDQLGPFIEFDTPNPVNVYARTKFEGENIVRELLHRYYIIRAGWMFGGKDKDKKFVGKISALCMNGQPIQIVTDKFGSPTYARDLISNIKELVNSGYYGLYHLANGGSCSRFEFAQEIANALGRQVEFIPITSDVFPLPAPRPKSEAGHNYKLDLIGLNRMRDWKAALHEYIGAWA